jgi:hypothetical protein
MSSSNTSSANTWYSSRPYPVGGIIKPEPVDPLSTIGDQELVFELIKRGYAVAKMDPQDMAEAARG